MNFRQLEYIIAVERYRNFNRASLACDVAQSTLSREIQRLEKEFDIIIFDRSRQPVLPTLKGLDLIGKAKEIRFQQKEFIQMAFEKKDEISGQINLAITEILAPYITPIFIKKITKKYPKLEIKILELSDRRIEDYLINEQVDAAVMINPSLTHGYYEQKLYKEKLCVYSTEIKQTENNLISLRDINFNEILLHEDLRDLLMRQIKDLGTQSFERLKNNKIKYLKGNLETLKNIIDMNGGTMFIPKIAAIYMSKKQRTQLLMFRENTLELDVNLVSTRGFEKKHIIKKLVNELSNLLEFGTL
ncbi:Redox-sensitive transcriptional activator [Polaribacter irgensii 23-P]|jgi:LysR family hydrogen peroxide-inducible transcriptional activator|uniref:Redox-sensitive transcriptional activator n=1 Tax=Polaribacter irgensii 23-P TaxID=313594 RepID=A4C0J1_9FLAO|nr:LysR substrate-binding domain-containing protein [Polaribacter irgensii]EAR12934.1 Redox-sensitive transcriptional activator [Polaribacter irgensii 23-P]